MAMSSLNLIESLREYRLLEDSQIREIQTMTAGTHDVAKLTQQLEQRGLLTRFQLEYLEQGKASDLILGPYVLLERIGEGGMGQVYKAYHRVLKSVRAIKIIRPDCLTSKLAIERFYREIQAVSRLNHPNIVMAHDAGQHDDTHYFVMEYAPGKDLGRIVKERGRLPVGEATEYIRQAALGLQHAYERGLVHRDIKPSNLLVSSEDGKVKILDMGLARLRETTVSPGDGNEPLTPTGAVMGTPDFMAPEQAEDSRRVDIRADIYSLGCTLYQLLTAQLPFAGGSLVEKLIRHRMDHPTPINQYRPDVPTELMAIVDRMMAKDPADRYQTPIEVAEALTPFAKASGLHKTLAGASLGGKPSVSPDAESQSSIPDTMVGASMHPDRLAASLLDRSLTPKSDHTEMVDASRHHAPTHSGATYIPPQTPAPRAAFPPLPQKPPRSPLVLIGLIVLMITGGVAGAILVRKFLLTPTPVASGTTSTGTEATGTQATRPTEVTSPRETTGQKVPPKATYYPALARTAQGETAEVRPAPAFTMPDRPMDWERLEQVCTFPARPAVRNAVFSGDGSRVALNLGETIALRGTEKGDILHTITVRSAVISLPGDVRTAGVLTVSADGKAVLFATLTKANDAKIDMGFNRAQEFDALVLWREDVEQPSLMYGDAINTTPVVPSSHSLAFTTREAKAALAGRPRMITVHDLVSGKTIGSIDIRDADDCVVCSRDGELAIVGGTNKLVTLCQLTRTGGVPALQFEGHGGFIYALAFAANSKRILSGGSDGQLIAWDPSLSKAQPGGKGPTPIKESLWNKKNWHTGSVRCIACTPRLDEDLFLTGGHDGTVCLGDGKTGEKIWSQQVGEEKIIAVSFSKDGATGYFCTESRLGRLILKPRPLTSVKTDSGLSNSPVQGKKYQ